MKIKALSRSAGEYTRERSNDIHKLQRNLDPSLHPFEKAREYTRALNATKLERMFAKPFIASLTGHADGVYCMAKHPKDLQNLISGSGDGEVRVWRLSEQQTLWRAPNAHKGIVRGVCAFPQLDNFISVGVDKTVKIWSLDSDEPVNTFFGKSVFNAVDHHREEPWFATSGNDVEIWDVNRSEPTQTFSWGADTINAVKFNQTETNILASCGTDRTITLYDLRSSTPLAKLVMQLKTNALAWNPMEAFNFTAANEDHNCYTFDMRKMDRAINVLKDHVSAVLDVDYSPTGEEIVTGSYDRSIRIFRAREGHSRDVYHTKRMQRIFCVKYSMDNKYVISGSDDANVRLWRANASERMGSKDTRERTHLEYNEKLKNRYKHLPEIRRIDKHRHVPRAIAKASRTKKVMVQSRKVKEENLRKHSKPGTVPRVAERKKNVVGVAK
ncbi:Protein sof1 [Basidiobolus ranarum]|uniref:Protein sof1 n=1 Tax=Basidiobolus ranarum TaxID=34480 RepID=A0ABR2VSJ0_9FUNG